MGGGPSTLFTMGVLCKVLQLSCSFLVYPNFLRIIIHSAYESIPNCADCESTTGSKWTRSGCRRIRKKQVKLYAHCPCPWDSVICHLFLMAPTRETGHLPSGLFCCFCFEIGSYYVVVWADLKLTIFPWLSNAWITGMNHNTRLCHLKISYLLRYFVCMGVFACVYVCAPHTCLVPEEARRRCWN